MIICVPLAQVYCIFLWLFLVVFMATLCNRAGHIYFHPFFFTLSSSFSLVRIQNAGLKRAAHGSLEMQDAKKSTKNRHLGTIVQFCRAISSQLRHVSTIGKKNLLSTNTYSTFPDNMVNFGPLTAEIGSGVWGTPANFNGFLRLGSITARQCWAK